MSARFAELMAMSAEQTRGSVATTQHILEEKRRREEQRNKEQSEREKRDRELQARQLRKRLEDERYAEERKRKAEEERRRKEEVIQQREEEQRKNLIYGKDHRSGRSSSGGGGRTRKSRAGSDDDDDTAGLVLTREEKRQRKLFSDLNKSFPSVRRGQPSAASRIPKKPNAADTTSHFSDPSSSRSAEPRHLQQAGGDSKPENRTNIMAVRKQLAAMPSTLMRLGTTKRDVRTIDEIVTDIHKKKDGKVIEGDEARRNGFDWFGEQKKLKKIAALVPSLSPTPSQSPRSQSAERVLASKASTSTLPRATGANERKEPRTKITVIKPETNSSLSFSKTSKLSGVTSAKSVPSSLKSSALHSSRNYSDAGKAHASSYRKRGRSDSLSDSDDSMDGSPPPSRRRTAASSSHNDISSEIWKLFGKDRSRYVQNDVFSDDEDDDMEADADALRREELRSARIAKREDELAEAEEKRHEEEKRKKKKEKDRIGH